MYEQIASNKRKSALMVALFIAFLLGLGWLFGYLLSESGVAGLIIALAISLVMTLISYYSGDKLALFSAGAKPLAKEQNPYVYRMVENLCIASGLLMPKIYIINDPAPNAFATGRDPQHSSMALTTGLISSLQNEELEGVISHELSHIKNYDIRVMTIIIVLAGTITLFSDMFLRGASWDDDGDSKIGVFLLILGIILAILSPIIGEIIHLAISRRREFLADASGALMTRYPAGLASALEKIAAYKGAMRHANHATAHLYISNPFGKTQSFLSRIFSTHPPIEERIKILRNMA